MAATANPKIPVSVEDGARCAVVLNRAARGSSGVMEALLQSRHDSLQICIPRDVDHLRDFVRKAAESMDRLIVGGGDGTLSLVVNALAPDFPAIDLGVLPVGTGNDLARALGLSSENLAEAGQAAFYGATKPVDAVRYVAGDKEAYFVNVANGGIGGNVAEDVDPATKELSGSLAYWLAGASAFASPRIYSITAQLISEGPSSEITPNRIEAEVIGVSVANGSFAGGGFAIAPNATVDDGALDVVMLPDLGALERIVAGARYIVSQDAEHASAHFLKCTRVELHSTPAMPFSIDGEVVKAERLEFEILPSVLRIARPSEAPDEADASLEHSLNLGRDDRKAS